MQIAANVVVLVRYKKLRGYCWQDIPQAGVKNGKAYNSRILIGVNMARIRLESYLLYTPIPDWAVSINYTRQMHVIRHIEVRRLACIMRTLG